jgi:hypothetical protein
MDALDTEPIYAAAFALASGLTEWKTKDRRFIDFSEVPAESMPALYQTQTDETPVYKDGNHSMPPKWLLKIEWWIYVNTSADSTVKPATSLNAILKALKTALKPDPTTGDVTLGGLIHKMWIDGKIELDEGVLGTTALAIVPITILVT